MKAKKQFGQNFLNSKGALEAIIDCSKIVKTDTILEIGPGMGALTEYLLKTEAKVVAIEKDPELIPILQEKFTHYKNLTLINGDVLEMNIDDILPGDFKLIANIPYYITGQILRMFIDNSKSSSMTLLVQKEVADRICKRGGDKNKESLVSLAVQSFGHAKYIKTVPAGSFTPAPKVDSAIIYIERGDKISLEDRKIFFDLIHAGFAHKRKFLISNLKEKIDGVNLEEIFAKIGLDVKIRSEDLKFTDWLKIVSCVKERQ
jgi:16S rRNA (adenine1518-N6/adenine1519-N6)-dimethyltransferase